MTDNLFVYGTLAPGQINHDVLSSLSGVWQRATLNGRLVDEGWGSGHGCPGIIPAKDAPEVEGFVFTSSELAAHWERLDAFEGGDYRRVQVVVRLPDDGVVDAHVYAVRDTDAL